MKPISKTTVSPSYHRYLKPGTLAQLRDLRISARSHKLSDSLTHQAIASLIRSPIQSHVPIADSQDRTPQFVAYGFGPRRLNRKKLVAARPVKLQSLEPASSSDHLIGFGGDTIANDGISFAIPNDGIFAEPLVINM